MKIKYVQTFRDRHGIVRHYYRRPGWPRVALPDPQKAPSAFMRAYQAAEQRKPLKATAEGTLEALIVEFMRSAEWRRLKPASQEAYAHIFSFIRSRPGIVAPVAEIRRRHVQVTIDELSEERPGKAVLFAKVFSRLMSFAVEREYRDNNPAQRLARPDLGEHRAWDDEEILAFEARWPRGTMQRRAYELALGTGQRRGDLAAMTWADRRDGVIQVTQEKTGARVWVPEHHSLAAELDAVRSRHAVMLHSSKGKAFGKEYLGAWFAEAIEAAGLPEDCVMHGLRKAAARRLAEAGCSPHEIMAITGHATLAEVERYTKDADRRTMARAAILKLEKKSR